MTPEHVQEIKTWFARKEYGRGDLTTWVAELLEYTDALTARVEAAERVVEWAAANAPEMECREDEECNHCLLVNLLNDLNTNARPHARRDDA